MLLLFVLYGIYPVIDKYIEISLSLPLQVYNLLMAWVVESIRESLVCLTSLATRSRVSITLFLVLEMTEWLLLFDTMIGGPCSV